MPKKILIIHNSYQQAGGEDTVVTREAALLRENGNEVCLHSVSNDAIRGLWRKAVTAWRTPYSLWGLKEITRVINETQPEVAHVHNFFPLLTPSIYDACLEAKVPVVQTLHNYRTICAAGLLMRDGKPCEDCIEGTPYQAVLHGCYRDSRLGSLAVARMIDVHRRRGTWTEKVDRFIVLTEFSKNKFVEAGFPSAKIAVKPNFVEVTEPEKPVNAEGKGALYVGRLSQEKGIETLLRAWRSLDVPLRIVGDGPLLEMVKGKARGTVAALGRKKPRQVFEEMARALFLVMPSECYENFPLTLVEAFAQGLPVIASRPGAMEEIIENKVTGLHFTAGDAEDLAGKVRWANEHLDEMREMGRNARLVYEEKYAPEINYRQLLDIYGDAIDENRRNRTTF
jgi:glycosyltransferase involved in cell wall biosynthesis